jgi:NADPH-dependent 2,4-dienoyl-CoA reductase/sulfur reductase-like enzyme
MKKWPERPEFFVIGAFFINDNCQTNDPDIYAGGDCVVSHFINSTVAQPMYVPLGSTANEHGRTIATHTAGHQTPFPGIDGTGVVKAFD